MTDETPAPLTRADVAARLEAVRGAYAALRHRLIAGGPWRLADDFGTGPEASWGPREVLAHCAEMLPFWLGELERVVEAGGRPGAGTPFGRLADDPMRLAILERDRTLPLRELLDRIDTGIARWTARLETLTDTEAAAVGAHPRAGDVPATYIRDRFVVSHLEEHAAQLDGILAGG